MDMSSKFLFFPIASPFAPIHTPCGHFSGLVSEFSDKENGQITPGFGSAEGIVQMLSFYFALFLPEYSATAGQDFLHLRWQNIMLPCITK
jgi:hypothetical protein